MQETKTISEGPEQAPALEKPLERTMRTRIEQVCDSCWAWIVPALAVSAAVVTLDSRWNKRNNYSIQTHNGKPTVNLISPDVKDRLSVPSLLLTLQSFPNILPDEGEIAVTSEGHTVTIVIEGGLKDTHDPSISRSAKTLASLAFPETMRLVSWEQLESDSPTRITFKGKADY